VRESVCMSECVHVCVVCECGVCECVCCVCECVCVGWFVFCFGASLVKLEKDGKI